MELILRFIIEQWVLVAALFVCIIMLIRNENQKSGVNKDELESLISYCKELDLDMIGLMCIPPMNIDPLNLFKEMSEINKSYNFQELSMGMSSDYLAAARYYSTYLRIGSGIFGQRT